MTSQPLLELHLHLVNGSTHKFMQHNPQVVEQILPQLNPRIFTQPTLVLFGQNTVNTYPSSALIGISLIMEPLPESLLRLTRDPALGVVDMQELAVADYQAKKRVAQPIVAGQPAVSLHEIEFVSGHRLWVEVSIQAAANKMEERQLVKHAFEGPNLVCRRLGGGLSIWNRAQMVSYSFSPKPEVPMLALPVEAMT